MRQRSGLLALILPHKCGFCAAWSQ